MKIGLVSTFNVECGISTYSEHLTEYYPENTIIFANKTRTLSDTKNQLKHKIIRCWEREGDYKELAEEIIKNKIDIIHFQHEFGLFQNDTAFRELLQKLKQNGIKIVITLHTVFIDRRHIMNRKLFILTPFINKIIVHDRNIQDIFNKIEVIEHGSMMVKAKNKEEAAKYFDISEDKIVCSIIGFISPNKGQIEAAQAVLNLRQKFPNILLFIVGMPVINGYHYENMEYCVRLYHSVKRMEGFNNIKIVPRFITEEEFDYYAGITDIFIENHGNTQYSTSGSSHLIMSYGKPSVSSKSIILHDLDETRSVKYNVGDIQGLSDSIEKLILDKDLRTKLGENALKFAKETSWDKIAKKHLDLYDRI
jgi:glycosyltransferase involved in cell wall biosynthesis